MLVLVVCGGIGAVIPSLWHWMQVRSWRVQVTLYWESLIRCWSERGGKEDISTLPP